MTDINAPQSSKKYWVISIILVLMIALSSVLIFIDKQQPSITNIDNDQALLERPKLSKAYTDAFTITERTEYGLIYNTVYVTITENVGKNQIINISNIFTDSSLTNQMTYGDIYMNLSYPYLIYETINVSIGKYSTTNTATINGTQVTQYLNNTGGVMLCEYVLGDKSCMVTRSANTRNETRWDYQQIPSQKSKIVVGSTVLEFKNGGIPIAKNATIQLKYTYAHPIAVEGNRPSLLQNKYDIEVCSSDGVDCSVLDPTWWSASWGKRKQINITSITSSLAENNYSVYLNITFDSDMQTDFKDIRFTDDYNNELPYWIESKTNSVNAYVWVKGNLSASTNTTWWLYYNNAGASSTSNLFEAFLVADNFTSGTLDTNRWGTSAGTINIANNSLYIDGNGALAYVESYLNFSTLSWLRLDFYHANAGTADSHQSGLAKKGDRAASQTDGKAGIREYDSGGDQVYAVTQFSSGNVGTASGTRDLNNLKKMIITTNNTSLYVERVGNGAYNPTGTTTNINVSISFVGVSTAGRPIRLANVTLRHYSNVEPTGFFGGEETVSTDADVPYFFDVTAAGNGSTYYPGFGTLIGAYINRTNGSVGVEWNGVNHSVTNLSNLYFDTFSDIAAGTYPYKMWAYGNGSTHAFNSTPLAYYTLLKNTTDIRLLINNNRANATSNNITPVTFTAYTIGINLTINLYRNGTLINSGLSTITNTTTIANVGNYTIKTNYTGNENYTTDSEQWNLEITPFASDYPQWFTNITSNPSPWTYRPTRQIQFNITWVDLGVNNSLNVTFYWDGVPKRPSNISNVYNVTMVGIAAGNYTYWWNATDQAGFSNRTENNTFIMEKNIPEGSITISPSDPEILNGTTTTVTGVEISDGDGDVIYNLTRDGVQVSNPDVQTFITNGTRLYNFSSSEGQNYTAGQIDLKNLTIIDGSLTWPTRRFNNSFTTENLTLTGQNNITRYVAVPSSVSFITQAVMNLSSDYYYNGNILGYDSFTTTNSSFAKGITSNSTNILILNGLAGSYNINVYDLTPVYMYNITLSYVSSGSVKGIVSNITNLFILNGNATGNFINIYTLSGNFIQTIKIFDKSLSVIGGNSTNLYVIYGTSQKNVSVFNFDGTNKQNFTLLTENIDTNSITSYLNYIYIHDSADDKIYVYNTSGSYSGLYFPVPNSIITDSEGGSTIANGMYLAVDTPVGQDRLHRFYLNITPKNINVSVGGRQAFYYPGIFNQTNNRTTNFYNIMNSYLSSCTYVSGWCYIPINFASSTGGILTYSDMIYSDVGFYENNNIYTASTYETKNETFIYNISYNSNFYTSSSANLIYDGITYTPIKTVTAGAGTFTKTIDIPLINSSVQNKSFYWVIYLTNNTGQTETYNSSMFNQTIGSILFAQCNTTLVIRAVNYSIYNETSRSLITSTFKATFEYFLGSGTVKKNTSVDLSASNNYTFCISPNATYTTDASIKLSSSGYLERSYFFNDKAYSNISTNQPLYLLDSGVGRTVILEFKDTSLRPLAGYYIETWRKYDALGIDLPVHIDKTDNFGQVVEDLVENTVKYKFRFYDSNNNLVKTTNDYVVVACRYTVCVITFLDDAQTNVIGFNNLSNYEYSLYFDNSTNTFIYSWNDNTGASPHHRLYVKKTTFGSDEVICNSSSTALTGSLSCYVGGNYSSYSAQAFRFASPEKRIGLINVQVGDITRKFGIEGLLWSFFLLMMLIVVGIWYPPVGVALYVVGFILLSVTGIVHAPPTVWIAQIAIGTAFIWAFRG